MRFRFLWIGLLLGGLCSGRFASANPVLALADSTVVGTVIPMDTLPVTTPSAGSTVMHSTGRTLQEVRVSAGPGSIDLSNPIHTEFINQRTLAKAACCNLSESFETNASVSVSHSDAVTGAKQIQFLGLGGQYVQTTVDNMPALRGLATTFGLDHIPGTWITGIDIGKGAGSVVNGYESTSGQINVELQKPDDINKLVLNGYVNSFGRVEGNVNWSTPLSNRWRMGVLGHVSTLRTERDQNGDGFRDLPLYIQLNAVNRYVYSTDRFTAQVGVKVLHEDRNGGQLSRFGEWRYTVDNATRRVEIFSKTAILYPNKPYRGLGLQLSGLQHEQTARIGFRLYKGQQRTIYANLIYQDIIGNTNHGYKAGLSYLLDDYREELATLLTSRTESVPGVFVEYTYTYPEKWVVVLGGRFDYHNLFGRQLTPRAHVKYTPAPGLALRASAGRGFRVPNPFAENLGYLASIRAVFMHENRNAGPFANWNLGALRPEIAWNYGLSLTKEFTLLGRKSTLILDYYRTDFRNQLVANLESSDRLFFYNLRDEFHRGRSFANSFQAELNLQPAKRLEVKLAYRLFDTKQSTALPAGDTVLLPRLMIPRQRVLLNVGYALPYDKWKADATLHWNGSRRIHYLREGYVHPMYQNVPIDYSPGFFNLNAQVSRGFKNGWTVYVGGENLTNFRQLNPIMAVNDPYGPDFDTAGRAWGPTTGRMVYAGFRFKPVDD